MTSNDAYLLSPSAQDDQSELLNNDDSDNNVQPQEEAKKRTCFGWCSGILHGAQSLVAFIEIVLASLWVHVLGICIGCIVFIESSLCAIAWVRRPSILNKCLCRLRIVKFVWVLVRVVVFAFVFILVLVHLMALDPDWQSFPKHCRRFSGMDNCARLAPGANYTKIPHFSTDRGVVVASIESYMHDLPRTHILKRVDTPHNTFIHSRVISLIMGYPDDFAVLVFCENNGTTVWVHSQSRLGKSDSGVNRKRVNAFVAYMNNEPYPKRECTH